MKAILFLGTSLVGAQYISDAVSELGYRPIFLLNIDEYSGDPRRAIERCEYYQADVNSLSDILRAIRENNLTNNAIAVTSLLDETLHHACAVAKQLNIQGPDAALSLLIDKSAVREIIPEFSPPSFVVSLPNLSEEKLNKFVEQNASFKEFMIKPGISSGAVGISILNQPITTDQIKKIIGESTIENAVNQNWIIQPRIMGTLYSLEGYVQDEKSHFLGFSKRIRKEFTEIASEFPADNEIPESIQQYCQQAVMALAKRSGYKNGYFHCEFIITSDSSFFIDGNMGRIAGSAIAQQIALIHGKNPTDIYKHVFDLGLFKGSGTSDFQYERITNEVTLNINYCLPKSAVVLDAIIPEDMTSYHTQIIANNGKETPRVVSVTVPGLDSLLDLKKM
jgi:hypothetical protein